ncbi:MAG: NAD(P)H-dependent oxidoreductase [Candidatus Bathyarchaeia archaeon]
MPLHQRKNCPIKDDVPKIWKQICNANAVIYGVPVYSGTIPALLKILFERSQALEPPTHTQTVGVIILGTYGHLNVLAALAPCLINYPHFKLVGYAMAIGWQKAIQNEKTRQEVIQLAENIYAEMLLSQK